MKLLKRVSISLFSGFAATLIANFAGFQTRLPPMVFFSSLASYFAITVSSKTSRTHSERDLDVAIGKLSERYAFKPDQLSVLVALDELRRELKEGKL